MSSVNISGPNSSSSPLFIPSESYINELKMVYGESKVVEIAARYNLFNPSSKHINIKEKDIVKILIGLNDIHSDDLNQFMSKIKQGSHDKFSLREQDAFKSLGEENVAKIKGCNSISQLPAPLFNQVIDSLRNSFVVSKINSSLINSPLNVDKISGIPGKYLMHGWVSFQSGRSLEDEERLMLYDELSNIEHTNHKGYCEILTKILVKKHLFYEQKDSKELKMGMLIPGMKDKDGNAQWYRVDNLIDTGLGKFAYKLVPATQEYNKDMPDLLLYRSSASLPTAMDSFTSYLNDLNVLPPGYLSRYHGKEEEVKWMANPTPSPEGNEQLQDPNTEQRPLIITGHSLGSSNAQLALINLQQTLEEKGGEWPNRKIVMEIFDSPALSLQDTLAFAEWINKKNIQQKMEFNYYVSHKDPVPLGGSYINSSYLGIGITPDKATSSVHKLQLKEEGEKQARVSGVGPHGRIFYRGKPDLDYTDNVLTIEKYNHEKRWARTAANVAKLPFVALVWGTLGVAGGAKRLIVGRRHHDSGLKAIFKKAMSAMTVKKQAIVASEQP